MILEVTNLCAKAEEPILRGVTLRVPPGQVHVIMGPNGAGKSTLAHVLAGHPSYSVTAGEAVFCGQDLLAASPEERAHRGLFLGFQYPIEVAGVEMDRFLLAAINAKRKASGEEPVTPQVFRELLEKNRSLLGMGENGTTREVNVGCSGGEKKRNEMLQLLMLDSKLAILDKTDSGLDVDAMKTVAEAIKYFLSPQKSCLLITHYDRFLQYVRPDAVHIMYNGRVVASGGEEMVQKVCTSGFEWARRL